MSDLSLFFTALSIGLAIGLGVYVVILRNTLKQQLKNIDEQNAQLELIRKERDQALQNAIRFETELDSERKQVQHRIESLNEAKEALTNQFKNLANEILEDKTKKFNSKNDNSYLIILDTDVKKIKDISNAGGFQSNIMELLFKLAFLSINNYFTSDFIIIDEIFDACSQENKYMAIKLVEYFKTQYKKILLVSHNQDIINLFDHRIVIKKDEINGNSILQA